jgi:hypothetical protein
MVPRISGRAWLVASAIVAGCATAPSAAPQSPAPPPAIAAASPAPNEIPWSAARRLTWADFQGPPPGESLEAARTVYLLSYESRCRGQEFQFNVAALFLPHQSWVRPGVLANITERARVLGHEQTHFDLTEVYARRMRRYFAELYNPCGLVEAGVKESVDRFVREEAEAQVRYDRETRYGLENVPQERWKRDVGEMLAKLASFADRR